MSPRRKRGAADRSRRGTRRLRSRSSPGWRSTCRSPPSRSAQRQRPSPTPASMPAGTTRGRAEPRAKASRPSALDTRDRQHREARRGTPAASLSAGTAASRPARAPSVRALADRADDAGAKRARDLRRAARCGSPRTSPHRARSSGSPGGRRRRRAGWGAVRARSHSSQRGRIWRIAAGETTSHPRRCTRHIRWNSAAPRG